LTLGIFLYHSNWAVSLNIYSHLPCEFITTYECFLLTS
jgi:hypothetical protein